MDRLSFLESPVIGANGNIIANDDSEDFEGMARIACSKRTSLALLLFRIGSFSMTHRPPTYDTISYPQVQKPCGTVSIRISVSSWPPGPLTLPPDSSVETTVAICIAQANTTSYEDNFGAVLLLTDFAHQVFGEVDSTPLTIVDTGSPAKPDTTYSYYVNHFVSPNPPNIPNIQTTALDQAVLRLPGIRTQK